MATDRELWDLAVRNVTRRQQEAFDVLLDRAPEAHLKGPCVDCADDLCARCEDYIVGGIDRWQENGLVDKAEAEYQCLLEEREELER